MQVAKRDGEIFFFFFLRNKRWRNLIILTIANITTSLATQSKKCFVLKEIIMKLAKEKRIDIDYDKVVEANHTTIACGSPNDVLPTLK